MISPRGLTFTWWGCCGLCHRYKSTEPAHSFLFSSCVCFFGPFNCISFHKFSRQLSVFSLCSSGLFSALRVLPTLCLLMKVSFSPGIIPSGWMGSKHQLTNKLVNDYAELVAGTILLKTNFFFLLFSPGPSFLQQQVDWEINMKT